MYGAVKPVVEAQHTAYKVDFNSNFWHMFLIEFSFSTRPSDTLLATKFPSWSRNYWDKGLEYNLRCQEPTLHVSHFFTF